MHFNKGYMPMQVLGEYMHLNTFFFYMEIFKVYSRYVCKYELYSARYANILQKNI